MFGPFSLLLLLLSNLSRDGSERERELPLRAAAFANLFYANFPHGLAINCIIAIAITAGMNRIPVLVTRPLENYNVIKSGVDSFAGQARVDRKTPSSKEIQLYLTIVKSKRTKA